MSAVAIIVTLEKLSHELLLFSAFWLLIGAMDDLCIDLIWMVRRLYRRVTYYRSAPPMRADQLAPAAQTALLAVFIPTWQEQNVIGAMLGHCRRAWGKGATGYRLYVGCYPNDAAGLAVIRDVAASDVRIRLVTLPHDGPTMKADCLNHLWMALLADEMADGYKAKAIVLHDAEDAVHGQELDVFDRLIEKAGAVQLPVIPVRTAGSRWVSGHYCDEFAEAHGKSLVVREALGAPLPLAGVACAIDRNLLGRIALINDGRPFDESSLTEDYELGLRIGAAGGRTIMARLVNQHGELVGTKACFPDTLVASARQKTRWLTGIALAGWDRLGWQGSLAQKWMLLHDRRSIFAALVLLAAYISVILTSLLLLLAATGYHQLTPMPDNLRTLLGINAAFLMWRLLVRACFVGSLYGYREALLSIPRSLTANIIAIIAARRACWAYLRHCFGTPLRWDKTTHHVVPTPFARHD